MRWDFLVGFQKWDFRKLWPLGMFNINYIAFRIYKTFYAEYKTS